ncbi:MAG: arginyltransferase [Thermodesulfobacteriota bacterium]
MSSYDEQCVREFGLLEARLAPFFAEMAVECPYHLPHDACFYQALFSPLADRAMELFLAAGYRRNGNCLYTMHCRDCSACVPIRIHPHELTMNRNQRRVLKKNHDLDIEFAPIEASAENIDLCEKFLAHRYPHKNNDGNSYYQGFFLNRIIPGMEIRYRHQGRLVGNGIVDIGENWMNAVYFYFDPEVGGRSPGTFNILTLVDICLKLDISYLYLGYYIEEVAAMNYKGFFSPHYLYLDSRWRKRGKRS